eukprot:12968786-Ditylum_brightwellii.AAC.1
MGLYDMMGAKHGINSPKTHINGKDAIDYILGTADAQEKITNIGMLELDMGIDSDHRGIFCDINKYHLLRGEIHQIAPKDR